MKKNGFNGCHKIIGSDLVSNKTLKVRNSTHSHTNVLPLISLSHIKAEQKVIKNSLFVLNEWIIFIFKISFNKNNY